MSQKKGVSEIKLTGIMGSDGYYHIVSPDTTSLNANGRHYNPVVLQYMVNGNRLNRRAFNTDVEHPVSRKTLFQKYLGLVPDDDHYRGTPAHRHPFMRTMALRFSMAAESVKLGSQRQVGKSNMIYAQLTQFHNHCLSELNWIKASKPIPIDLTRYARLLKWEAVKTEKPEWLTSLDAIESRTKYDRPFDEDVAHMYLNPIMPTHRQIQAMDLLPDLFAPTNPKFGKALTEQLNREALIAPRKRRG